MASAFIKISRLQNESGPLTLFTTMREFNVIQAAFLLCLVPLFLNAAEKLRIGDFPTESERKEDDRERRRAAPAASPFPTVKPSPTPFPDPTPASRPTPRRMPPSRPTTTVLPERPKPAPVVKSSPTPAFSTAEAKRRSDELYLQALAESQQGNTSTAYKLCIEALKLDPQNLQAERMSERLRSRIKK